MLSRPPPRPHGALPAASRIRDTEDYLTARAANPRTGLITPFTPLTPAGRGVPGQYISPDERSPAIEMGLGDIHVPKRRQPVPHGAVTGLGTIAGAIGRFDNAPRAQKAARIVEQAESALAKKLPVARPSMPGRSHPLMEECRLPGISHAPVLMVHPRLRDLRQHECRASDDAQKRSYPSLEPTTQPCDNAPFAQNPRHTFGHRTAASCSHVETKAPPGRLPLSKALEESTLPIVDVSALHDTITANQGNEIRQKPVGSFSSPSISSEDATLTPHDDTLLFSRVPQKVSKLSDRLPKLCLRRPSQAGMPRSLPSQVQKPHSELDVAISLLPHPWPVVVQFGGSLLKGILQGLWTLADLMLGYARQTQTWHIAMHHLRVFSDDSLTPEERRVGLKNILAFAGRLFVFTAFFLFAWSVVATVKSTLELILSPVWALLRVLTWLRR